MYNNISIERLEQIELERNQTIADLAYQRWMKELQVGSMYIDRQLIHNANLAMQDWDSKRFRVPDIKV
jgi:ribosomal protein L20